MTASCSGTRTSESTSGCTGLKSPVQRLGEDHPYRIDASLQELRRGLLESHDRTVVRAYTMTSVDTDNGDLIQTGCGPNIEGGLLTLCTCKHFMRAADTVSKGDWLAGFASSTLREDRRNPLFYVTRIQEYYDSYVELWEALGPQTRRAKDVTNNPVGDLYRPLEDAEGKYGPENFHSPCSDHVHKSDQTWRNDVMKREDRGAHKLIIGDPAYTFVWQTPRLLYSEQYHPRQKNHETADFIDLLDQSPNR